MTDIVKAARADEDSIGGVCSVVVRNCPIGMYTCITICILLYCGSGEFFVCVCSGVVRAFTHTHTHTPHAHTHTHTHTHKRRLPSIYIYTVYYGTNIP